MKFKIIFQIFLLIAIQNVLAETEKKSNSTSKNLSTTKKSKAIKLICEATNCTIKNLYSTEKFRFSKPTDLTKAAEAKSLNFKSSKFSQIPPSLDKSFPKLKVLDLSGVGLEKIQKKDIEKFTKLKVFIAKNNKLDFIPQDLFEKNKLIREIDLSFNVISVLKILSIRNLNKLKTLDLSGNKCIDGRFDDLNSKDTNSRKVKMEKILKNCFAKKKKQKA